MFMCHYPTRSSLPFCIGLKAFTVITVTAKGLYWTEGFNALSISNMILTSNIVPALSIECHVVGNAFLTFNQAWNGTKLGCLTKGWLVYEKPWTFTHEKKIDHTFVWHLNTYWSPGECPRVVSGLAPTTYYPYKKAQDILPRPWIDVVSDKRVELEMKYQKLSECHHYLKNGGSTIHTKSSPSRGENDLE